MPSTLINQPGAGVGPIPSSSSITIGTGSKTFTVESGLSFSAGAYIQAVESASNWIGGTVTSYVGTQLIVNIANVSGSGTFTSWTINTAPQPIAGAWQTPALNANWVNATGQNVIRYRLEADTVTVRLSGATQQISGGGGAYNDLFTIAAGFRPTSTSPAYGTYDQNGNSLDTFTIGVFGAGFVEVVGSGSSLFGFEGVTYSTV